MALAETVGGALSVMSVPQEMRYRVFGIEINGNKIAKLLIRPKIFHTFVSIKSYTSIDMKTIIHNNHLLVVTTHGTVLVDTGSPVSFHKDGLIEIEGEQFKVPTSCLFVTDKYISRNVGIEVAGLIGMDLLKKLQLHIDVNSEEALSFYNLSEELPVCEPVETFNASICPGIIAEVGGKRARLIFDTGAPISYLSKEFTEDTPIFDEVEDFSPLLGGVTYTVERHLLTTTIAGHTFDVAYGDAPQGITNAVRNFNADGIIGWDLIKRFKFIIHKGTIAIPQQQNNKPPDLGGLLF